MKIAIIGAGIFGITAFIKLRKKGHDCYLFDKNRTILGGASTKNLNRIHLGYHYPRDPDTIVQSKKSYKSFISMYGKSVITNFNNYYAISKFSKTSSELYEKVLKKFKLKFKIVDKLKNIQVKNLEKIYEVEEPIYSWSKIKSIINKKIKNDKKRIFLNSNINHIKYNSSKFILKLKKKEKKFDLIIDASYEGSNNLVKRFVKLKDNIYQLTNVLEIKFSNMKNFGLCVMDGPFFSFLPQAQNNKTLLYHVKYSVLKNKKTKIFNKDWFKINTKLLINKQIIKTREDLKSYFPNLKFRIIKNHISARVFEPKNMKSSKRVSYIKKLKKNYYKIFSGKVDHAVLVANNLEKLIKKIK